MHDRAERCELKTSVRRFTFSRNSIAIVSGVRLRHLEPTGVAENEVLGA